MKDKIIILFGMPGAGKGAVSQIMRWQPNVTHVSTGGLLRALDPESELGKKVRACIDAGQFASDDLIYQMVGDALVPGKDILLDGFPRKVSQAEWLMNGFADKFDMVAFLLNLDESVATARRDKGINDYILRGEEPRKDDTDLTVLPKRFAEYRSQTEPTVEFMREKLGANRFFDIDGRVTLEDVYDSVMKILTGL